MPVNPGDRFRLKLQGEPCRWCGGEAHAVAVVRKAGTKGGRHRDAQKQPVCVQHAESLWFQGAEIVAE